MCSNKYRIDDVTKKKKIIPYQIVKRAETLMPEFITTKHKNRTI